ncbi:MAG: sigma-70 family RNA polymerase sigma factor [Bacteroidota bacterium]
MKDSSDKEIWDDFRNGEEYALSHIYHQHIHLLYRYGKKFVSNDDLIKDTIQDLFFDLIKSRKKLGETDNIRFYLMASFRRKLATNLKKQNRALDIHPERIMKAEITYSAEKIIIDKEELTNVEELIHKALEEISPKQREILFYRYSCNLDYEQICVIMSLKYDSARKLVFRALKSLKGNLSGTDIQSYYSGIVTK